MYNSPRYIAVLLPFVAVVHCRGNWNLTQLSEEDNVYDNCLKDINKERPFHAMLILHQERHIADSRVASIYKFPMPKIILTKNHGFDYKTKFNTEIIAIVILANEVDKELLATTADTLENIRQDRILVVAIDVVDTENFSGQLLRLCEMYKMTNVLLSLINSREEATTKFSILKPYPEYHWDLRTTSQYFPVHWKNMENKTLVTHVDQLHGRALAYYDSRGNLQLNGVVARLILLFAERFNASLKMYQPIEVGESMQKVILKLTKEDKLDLPMRLKTGRQQAFTLSDYVELGGLFLIVPCAPTLSIREIYGKLLNWKFFGCVFMLSLILSIIHSLHNYYLNVGLTPLWNLVLNHHVLPGVLGQSFATRITQQSSLRIVYFLIGFVGIMITAQFAANLDTFLTTPPYHRQIKTIADLVNSKLQIPVTYDAERNNSNDLQYLKRSYLISNDTQFVHRNRDNFNTSYAYYVTTALWNLYSQQQEYYAHKSYCTYENLSLYPLLPWGVLMPKNSPHREALNFLINRVHEVGLTKAWESSTFTDMMRLKMISLRDPNPPEDRHVWNVNDLFWVWMVVVIGLACSILAFLVELFLGRWKCTRHKQ